MVAKGKTTQEHDEKDREDAFLFCIPLYLDKVLKKGRSEKELQEVITWLTGFEGAVLTELIKGGDSLEAFLDKAQFKSICQPN